MPKNIYETMSDDELKLWLYLDTSHGFLIRKEIDRRIKQRHVTAEEFFEVEPKSLTQAQTDALYDGFHKTDGFVIKTLHDVIMKHWDGGGIRRPKAAAMQILKKRKLWAMRPSELPKNARGMYSLILSRLQTQARQNGSR